MAISPLAAVYVRTLVRSRAGIVLDEGKDYLIESRLAMVAQEHGLATTEEVVARAQAPASGIWETRVVEALTTNETSFFRDFAPFEGLRARVIPEMMAARAASRSLTIWSAAASTGQEAYSIAMILREHFPELLGWRVRIVATDLAGTVLERARAGRYRQLEVNRGMPANLLVKYFVRDGNEWCVVPEVRAMVDFSALNLVTEMHRYPLPDIAFVRNVLFYFDGATKEAILRRVATALPPDGVLFLGGTESNPLEDVYERITVDRCVYYRQRRRSGGRDDVAR